jgi:hypothetical protein
MDMITTTATTTRRVTRTARGDAMSQLATRARVASSATATTRARRRGGDGAGERASAPVVAPRLGSRCRRRVVLARRRASEEPLVARVSSAAPEERARADGGGDDDGDPKPPPTSAAAETARKNVDAAVAASSASSAALANNLDNQYLATQERFPSLPLPPEPIRFPRSPVDIKLAVMLLRSAYETVDDMNVIPMDQFQVRRRMDVDYQHQRFIPALVRAFRRPFVPSPPPRRPLVARPDLTTRRASPSRSSPPALNPKP